MFDFKGLISALLRKKDGDPVGDLKSATIWVQELPQSDIHMAQHEIVKSLGKLNKNPEISLKERIRVMLYLDEKAHTLQETLCREYLATIDTQYVAARQLLPTILLFWEEMAAGYQRCIREFAASPGSKKIGEQMPLLTAKAMHYFSMQSKWSYIRYMPVEPMVWRNLHRLYQFAELEKFDRAPVQLFPQMDDTTCASEYMQAMMLHLANPASLLPSQIETVDFWLDSWAKSLMIEPDFRPHRQLYAINLGDSKPARKLRRNMLGEKYRYWGVGLLQVTITKIVDQLQRGELPVRLKLGEDCRLPACLELIEEIANRWAGQSTVRKHERTPAEKTLLVVQGLGGIALQLRGGKQTGVAATYEGPEDDTGIRPSPKPSGEAELFGDAAQQWQVTNESLSGYGVNFRRNGAGQIKIGTLVSLRSTTAKQIAIGVVRRIIHESPSVVHAGIQTLSQTPIAVELHPLPGEAGKAENAIYLPELPKLQLGRSLLLADENYSPGKQVVLKSQGKTYTIRLQPAVERGLDFVRAGFDVLSKNQ